MVRVVVEAPLHPTEDPEKVARALLNLFPNFTLERLPDRIRGLGEDLGHLGTLVRTERIPDSARNAILSHHTKGSPTLRFTLGKQAAFWGRLHFDPPPSPLGEITCTAEGTSEEEVLRLLYRIAPDTTVPEEMGVLPPFDRPSVKGRASARTHERGAP